jgi:long-chain fatty acid transport protein
MQRHRLTRYLAGTGLLLVALPMAGRAQGFGVNEIGSCASSRGFAVTGAPCKDASAVFWNPGAITGLSGFNLLGGATILSIGGAFEEDTTFRRFEGDVPTLVVPHLFLTWKPTSGMLSRGGKLAWGLGVYVPYGLTSQWTDSFPGRFSAKKAELATIYVQPTVAYQVNERWSVGFGPVIGHSDVELIQHLDLSEQVVSAGPPIVRFSQLGISRHTDFGRAVLAGDAMAFGTHLGIYGKPNERWSVGLRFLSPLTFKYEDADATFTQITTGLVLPPGNPLCAQGHPICGGNVNATVNVDALVAPNFAAGGNLTAQGVKTQITHPAQVQFGVGYHRYQNWLLSADYTWTGWRRFRELPVDFEKGTSAATCAPGPGVFCDRVLIEDYNNTSAIRVGAERMFTSGAALRVGFAGVASAAPDETVTPLLPEQDRSYMSIGGGYPIFSMGKSKVTLEGAYLRVQAGGKRGRIDERSSRTSTAAQINTGLYTLDANVFSVSLKVGN